MGIQIVIPQQVITYTSQQYDRWVRGEREDCSDPYCKRLPRSCGFGEFIVGQHFEKQGYRWIHHDYNIFGGNKLGKHPLADEVLQKYFGEERFMMLRTVNQHFDRFQEPDLMIFSSDHKQLRFAECKREDTKDKLDIEQVRGLAIIAALLECEVELYLITKDNDANPEPLSFELPETLTHPGSNILMNINECLQNQLKLLGRSEVTAVEAAQWLEQAGLLRDSKVRPGKPLRDLLRMKLINGQYQLRNHRWFIKRID